MKLRLSDVVPTLGRLLDAVPALRRGQEQAAQAVRKRLGRPARPRNSQADVASTSEMGISRRNCSRKQFLDSLQDGDVSVLTALA